MATRASSIADTLEPTLLTDDRVIAMGKVILKKETRRHGARYRSRHHQQRGGRLQRLGPEDLQDGRGRRRAASAIYIDKRGRRFYGKKAYDQAVLSPENTAHGFKRLMGTSTPFEFAGSGQSLTPEECSAEILRQLLAQAYLESGEQQVTGAIVTIPAAFNQMQCEATLRAAHAAGLERSACSRSRSRPPWRR